MIKFFLGILLVGVILWKVVQTMTMTRRSRCDKWNEYLAQSVREGKPGETATWKELLKSQCSEWYLIDA